jgi:hypothetical protein
MSATRFAVSVKHTFLVCGEGETETVVQVGEFGSGWAIVSVR